MEDSVDLHVHSTCSDGTLSPREIARLAKKIGLRAIALTDHDTMRGVADFADECGRLGLEAIPGAELGTEFHRELHIVALLAHGEEFDEFLARLGNSRGERNLKILDKLHRDGYKIEESDMLAPEKGVTINSCGRPHIAAALVRKGYCVSINDAFARLIGRDCPYYAKRFSLPPTRTVELIKRCGGIAIWAHPAEAADTEEEMLETAEMLKAAGLDAMECLYSRYTDENTAMCFHVASKVGILPSGGSDFHGAHKPDVRLGEVHGGFIPYEIWENLKRAV